MSRRHVTFRKLIDGEVTDLLIRSSSSDIVESIKGSVAHTTHSSDGPALELITYIKPFQTGSGDPSPVNMRVIHGWDVTEATGAGRNLFSPRDIKPLPYTINGITFSDGGDGKIAISGTATATASMALINRGAGKRDFIKAGTYTVSGSANQTNATVYYVFYADQTVAMTESFLTVQTSSGSPQKTFTLDRDCYYGCYIAIVAGKTPTGYTTPQLEIGTEATTYEPYQARTLTAELPETVYGGLINWTKGEMMVDKGKIVLDGNNFKVTSVYQTSDGVYYASLGLPRYSFQTTVDRPNNPLSDKLVTKKTVQEGCCYITGSTNKTLVIALIDQSLTTVDAINEWLANNPITIVYDLAEPYTIQLTPQQLNMLKGVNNVWSNTGDTELTYIADTKTYIDEKFDELQNAILALGGNL